jgi:predicted nuclease of predicted toxin-antitoxin system
LNGKSIQLRVLLDEGVPSDVAKAFAANGHEVIPFEEAVKRGAEDLLVCAAAEANNAILVAFDKDMSQIARRLGISGSRFKKLSLIKLGCSEPLAAKRLAQAMSFIEHEWAVADTKAGRRLFVEIGTHVLRSWR